MQKLSASISTLVGLASVFSLLNLPGAIAAPKGWVRVFTDPANNLVYYIDNGTIQRSGAIRYFWVYMTSADGNPVQTFRGQPVHSLAGYMSAHCTQGVVRVRSAQLLDARGKTLQEENYGDQGPLFALGPRRPGGLAMTQYACARR